MKPIYFCRLKDPYGEFSNFYRVMIFLDGKEWPSTEHYYQAQKHIHDPKYMEIIRKSDRPATAAELGRDPSHKLRSDWDDVKVDVMFKCVMAKFEQNPELKKILLSTGNARIFEYSKKDDYWGTGEDYTGENMLGKVIMLVRDRLSINQDIL